MKVQLLAPLVLTFGRSEQLVDAVWNGYPPSTARGQIQTSTSPLRTLFGASGRPDAIKIRPSGYLLDIANDYLDSERFVAMVASPRADAEASRTVEAADTLRTALAPWRGPALARVPSELVRRAAALREDRRFAAVEERIRLDLMVGRRQQVVRELRALCAEHPLRERRYGLLMVAVYRSGQQAEALEVCHQARSVLINDIGVEPCQGPQDLEHAILANERGSLNWTQLAK